MSKFVKVGLVACGESFAAWIKVPDHYFSSDGVLNRTALVNRLSCNMGVTVVQYPADPPEPIKIEIECVGVEAKAPKENPNV